MAANKNTFVPTASETAIMLAVIKNLTAKSSLQCDWARVASELGYRAPKVANDRWNQVRKKIAKCEQATSAGDDGAAAVKTVKPKSQADRKRKHDMVDGGGGTIGADIQPAKLGKRGEKTQPEAGELADAKNEDGDE